MSVRLEYETGVQEQDLSMTRGLIVLCLNPRPSEETTNTLINSVSEFRKVIRFLEVTKHFLSTEYVACVSCISQHDLHFSLVNNFLVEQLHFHGNVSLYTCCSVFEFYFYVACKHGKLSQIGLIVKYTTGQAMQFAWIFL